MSSGIFERPLSLACAPHRVDEAAAEATVPAGAGYIGLFMLALALPFELTQRPLIQTRLLTLTNLKLIEFAVAFLGVLALALPLGLLGGLARRPRRALGPLAGRETTIALFCALLLCSLLSSLAARERLDGLKWTLDLAVGGVLWLALPLWLGRRRVGWLAAALVTGAVAAALVGFLEFLLGPHFAASLTMFKAKPTMAGPYLRLSATFEYANIAALYFELTFPFAVAGLLGALAEARISPARVLLWLVAAAILLEAILLTYSRGALLGLGLALTAFMALGWGSPAVRALSRPARRVLAASVGLGAGVVLITLAGGSLTALRLSTQSDQDWYQAAYLGPTPRSLGACSLVTVPITVVNRSPLLWQVGSYHLGYHWLAPSGRVALFDGLRTPLHADLPSGGRQTLAAALRAPRAPGRYLLVWDMVQEDVTWFSLKSASYGRIPVVVRPLPRGDTTACRGVPSTAQLRRRLAPSSLPTVLQEPNRRQLWAAALAMLRAHTFLGVGPDGFRLNYGLYATPRQRTWDQRILANSLYLELSADLGLAGALVLVAFVLAATWPLLRLLHRRVPLDPLQMALVAALAAFLGHGLVDYNLESHAIFILFWLLLGMLAASCAGAGGAGERGSALRASHAYRH